MAEMRYLDFDLLIERAEEGYTARVLNSPAGRAIAKFSLPFSELELENFLLRVGRTRRGVRRLESPEMQAAKAFGGRLFRAVFGNDVRGCLHSSLDEADRQRAGLRVRLRLAEAPELTDLPWEYLYNPALNRFFVLSAETPLVRYLDLPERIRPLAVKPPLRVLVMISCPSDHPPLDMKDEWVKLKEALGDLEQRGLVALERLQEATLMALQRRLRRGAYHIFHFIGHGGFDERAQDGVLLLEDKYGRGRPVSGQYLGTLLHDERTLRLAILNACEGARTARTDPFAGTAQSLVQQGIPAVIAMQFEITDEAAITLAHEFYAALADGYPVDAALAEARKAIFAQENDVEWGTPVLYMRAPDGHIFDVAQVGPARPGLPRIAPKVDRELERLYSDGLSAFRLEEWERACRNFQAIVELRPDYQDAAAKLKEAQHQWKLTALSAQAQGARKAEAWQGALSAPAKSAEIEVQRPMPSRPKRRLPRWAVAIIGSLGLAAAAAVVAGAMLLSRGSWGAFEATSIAAPVVAAATATATPTSTPASTATPTATPAPTEMPTVTPRRLPSTATPTSPRSTAATPTAKSLTATHQPTSIPSSGALLTFEQWTAWRRGDQPYGELVQTEKQVRSGRYAAKLGYYFPATDEDYVVFICSLSLAGQPNTVGGWVYGDGSGHFLNVWVQDAQSEIWSAHLGRVGDSGWRQMVGSLDPSLSWPSGHVSGPENGVIDYPVRFYALVLDRPGSGPRSGQIYIDDVSVWRSTSTETDTPSPAATATPTTGEQTPTATAESTVSGGTLDFPVPTQLDGWEPTEGGYKATIILRISGGVPPFTIYHDTDRFTTEEREYHLVFSVGGCNIIHSITVESADGQSVSHDYFIRAPSCD